MGRARRRDHLKPLIAADPVVHMHNQIAGHEALGFGQEILGFALFAGGADQPVAQHILLGDDRQPFGFEPVIQRPDRKVQAVFANARAVRDRDDLDQTLVLDQPGQTLPRAFGIGRDHNRPMRHACPDMGGQRFEDRHVFLLALGCKIATDPAAGVDHPRPGRLRQRRELQQTMAGDRLAPRGIVHIEQIRRRRLVYAVEPRFLLHCQFTRFILVRDAFPPGQTAGRRLVIQRDRRVRQIIEQRFQLFVEERQPVFNALMLAPGADRLVQRIVCPSRAKFDTIALSEPGDRRLVKDHLGHGREFDYIELLRRALAGRVKAPGPVQHIAKQVKPHRTALARRVDVDDTAPDRVITRLHHRRALREPHAHKEIAQSVFVDPVANPRGKRRLAQDRTRRNPLRGRIQCRQQDKLLGRLVYQRCQRRHARRRNIRIRRNPVIRQAVPTRECQHRHVRRIKCQRRGHRRQPLVIARDMHNRPVPARDFIKDQTRVETFGRAAHCDMVRCRHGSACDGCDAGSEHADGNILVHAPQGSYENRKCPDNLRINSVSCQTLAEQFSCGLFHFDQPGRRQAQQPDHRHGKAQKEQRLREFDTAIEPQNREARQNKAAKPQQPKPRHPRDVKQSVDVDAGDILKVRDRLTLLATGTRDHIVRNAKHPMARGGPDDGQSNPEPEI